MKYFVFSLMLLCIGTHFSWAQPTVIKQLPLNSDQFFVTADRVYFRSGDSLMCTDGTSYGTVLLKNGMSSLQYNPIREFNGLFFFSYDGGVWSSDGTPLGTVRLADLSQVLETMGGYLFFVGNSAGTGKELYKTDGTSSGTFLVKDINPGPEDGFAYSGSTRLSNNHSTSMVFNGELYFGARDDQDNLSLWKSDGSETGTIMVKELTSFQASIKFAFQYDARMYFLIDHSSSLEFFVSDGSLPGTVSIQNYLLCDPEEFYYFQFLDTLYGEPFFITSITHNPSCEGCPHEYEAEVELHKINKETGEPARDYYFPYDENYFQPYRVSRNESYIFLVLWGYYGTKLWRIDGTPGGVVSSVDTDYIGSIIRAGNYIVCGTDDNVKNLVKTDGTNGTHKIAGINQAYFDDNVFMAFKEHVYAGVSGFPWNVNELLRVDLQRDTVISFEHMYGVRIANVDNMFVFNNFLYFTTKTSEGGNLVKKLWKYDDDQPQSYFTWVDADTDTDLKTIQPNDTLKLVAGKTYNIRYNTLSNAGSVVFNGIRTENSAPYAVGGDNNGNYNAWSGATPGTKSLTATVYSGANGSGSLVETRNIQFTLINEAGEIDFILINANSNQEIDTLVNGFIIDVASIGTNKLNIKAHSRMPGTSSVVFDYNGNPNFRKENVTPYSLFGDANGNYAVYHYANGIYMLKATPYTGTNGSGAAGIPKTISFQVVNSSARIHTFPNPVENVLQLTLEDIESHEQYHISVTDLAGRVCYQGVHTGAYNTVYMDSEVFTPGVYIVKVTQSQHTETLRVYKR